MQRLSYKPILMMGASAAVAAGAIGVAVLQEDAPDRSVATSDMSVGQTVTESAAPTTLSVPSASPGITGPAPLPSEEQGLPGS